MILQKINKKYITALVIILTVFAIGAIVYINNKPKINSDSKVKLKEVVEVDKPDNSATGNCILPDQVSDGTNKKYDILYTNTISLKCTFKKSGSVIITNDKSKIDSKKEVKSGENTIDLPLINKEVVEIKITYNNQEILNKKFELDTTPPILTIFERCKIQLTSYTGYNDDAGVCFSTNEKVIVSYKNSTYEEKDIFLNHQLYDTPARRVILKDNGGFTTNEVMIKLRANTIDLDVRSVEIPTEITLKDRANNVTKYHGCRSEQSRYYKYDLVYNCYGQDNNLVNIQGRDTLRYPTVEASYKLFQIDNSQNQGWQ
jgi:hypothetical protein